MRAIAYDQAAGRRDLLAAAGATAKALHDAEDMILRPYTFREVTTALTNATPWEGILCRTDLVGAAMTVLLPPANDNGVLGTCVLVKINTDAAQTVTIAPVSGTIDGGASIQLVSARSSVLAFATAFGWVALTYSTGDARQFGGVTTAAFTQPSIAGTVSVSVDTTEWLGVGMYVRVGTGGNYRVSAVTNATTVVLQNTGDQVPTRNRAAGDTIDAASDVKLGSEITDWIVDGDTLTDYLGATTTAPQGTFDTAGGGSLGNGTVKWMWSRIGGMVCVRQRFTTGTTTTYGTGAGDPFRFTAPNTYVKSRGISTTTALAGSFYLLNVANQLQNQGGCLPKCVVASGNITVTPVTPSATNDIAQGVPFTWTTAANNLANGDYWLPIF